MAGAVQDIILKCFETGEGTRYGDYHASTASWPRTARRRLEAGIEVLDAGCGAGRALIALAARYPQSRFTGYDLYGDAIAAGQKSTRAEGLGNLRFEKAGPHGFRRGRAL